MLPGQRTRNQPTRQQTWVRSLGREDALEEEVTTHSSSLAWGIPWTEEPGRHSPWASQRLDTTERLTHTAEAIVPETDTTLLINYTPI